MKESLLLSEFSALLKEAALEPPEDSVLPDTDVESTSLLAEPDDLPDTPDPPLDPGRLDELTPEPPPHPVRALLEVPLLDAERLFTADACGVGADSIRSLEDNADEGRTALEAPLLDAERLREPDVADA